MNKVILTDCDGVLLDWETQFKDWMQQQGYTLVDPTAYNMNVAYNVPKEESKRLVKIFNESAWMGFLPALRDARSGVAKLVEAGYQFIVITSLSLDAKAKMLRVSNLKNIFGKDVFLDVVCLDTGADKDDALAEYKNTGMYWLEDKTENALCGVRAGLKSILITHDHNLSCNENKTDIIRCDSWSDIVDVITQPN